MAEDLKRRFSVKQIQLAIRVGLELGSSGLQVQHSNRSATPPPSTPECNYYIVGCYFVTCTFRFKLPSYWKIRVGEWDLKQVDGYEQDVNIKAIYTHGNYNSSTNENDIALVYLHEPVQLNERVNPVCLANKGDAKAGTECVTFGWGSSSFQRLPAVSVLSVKLPLVSREICNAKTAFNDRVTKDMICAGVRKGEERGCFVGDGGAPLVCKNEYNRWVLVGISSWGGGCVLPTDYRVFTLVESFNDWILRHISR